MVEARDASPANPSPARGRVARAGREPGGESRGKRTPPGSLGYRLRSATLPEDGEG